MTTTFAYKSLDGWLIPGTGYFRKLQEHALQLEQELKELKENLAVSGSRALQDRAEKWSEEWQAKCIEVGELQKQLIELESQKDAEIMRLQYRAEFLEEQLEQYQARLEEYQTADKPNSQRKRDSESGKFVTDIPKKEKMRIAYTMHNNNYTDAQIARRLNVTSQTVKNYVSTYQAEQNRKWLEMQSQQVQNKQDYNGVICYG